MRILIVTNILTPYRRYFFDLLYEEVMKRGGVFKVAAMTDTEPLRPWKYEQLKRVYTELLPGMVVTAMGEYFCINFSIFSLIRRFQPDVLVLAGCWSFPTVWMGLLCRKLGRKVGVVMFWTESHAGEKKSHGKVFRAFRDLVRGTVYRQFDAFWIPGALTGRLVDMLYRRPADKFLVPNLVDSSLYQHANRLRHECYGELRAKYGLAGEAFVFICPARLTEVKGLLPFLQNAGPVLKGRKTAVVIAGDGPLHDSIAGIADHNSLDVRLLGQCTPDVMVELYASADAFLLPSLSDPNPLSAIEAAWAGLPLVVSKYVGNHPELVEEGINGVVFDTLDKEDVVEKVGRVLAWGKDYLESAGKRSYELAAKRFYGPVETKRLLDELQNYIDKRKTKKHQGGRSS